MTKAATFRVNPFPSPVATARRHFLQQATILSAACLSPPLLAEQLTQTATQTEGPFYPDKLPLDTDNDLLVLNDNLTMAVGEITHLTGRILTPAGEPVRNAVVEIWQADSSGCYLHAGSANKDKQDRHFQGFGRFLTSSKGEYYFRTIKPVAYPGRTPHIHFAIDIKGERALTTQCYIQGHPQNEKDGVLLQVHDARAKETLMVDWNPIPDSKLGEYSANFDIVLGVTPDERALNR